MTEPPLPEESIFAQALELAAAERVAFLDRACKDNQPLRNEVEALLRAHERSGDLLDLPESSPATTDLPACERPGTVIGPYKLLEEIGEGGMGTVWMAEQTEPIRRRVAVKVVKEGMDSRQVLARFEAERQALAVMEHPNIARVLDAGRTPSGRPYFVMELVKGQSIAQYCDEKRLGVRERLELFGDVCRAVQHAHQKGIIHRDVKPSNVLVAPYDGKPVVKVIDFGVAKATGQRLTDKTLFTGFGALVGTPEYMSPEQAEVNNQDIDTRSDIYSLGVLLYELLTGSTPLTRKRIQEAALLEVLRVIREEEPPRPSTRLSESKDALPSISAQRRMEPATLTKLVRGELDWIVMKALEKDRSRRYETANGLAEDVRRYLADEPVQACPPSTTYRLRKLLWRNRVWVSAALLVAAVLVVATTVSTALAVRALNAEKAAQEDRARAMNLARTEAAANAQAGEQTRLANERAEVLARRLYIYRVNLALREAVANNVAQADVLLAECEPARRGWEWAYTRRLCHLEAMTLGGFADHAAAVAGARRRPGTLEPTGDRVVDDLVRGLAGTPGGVRRVASSPDGRRIAAARDDGTIGLYDARTGRELQSLAGHVGVVTCVAFDAAGGRLLSGGLDRTVRVWDAHSGEQRLVLRGHARPVLSVAFRPGTEQAASSEHGAYETFDDGFVLKQWDLAAGREIRTLRHRHGWTVTWVAFSPDGRRLLSASSWGGFLRLWDPETGKETEARQIADGCGALAVNPADGRVAYSGSEGVYLVGPAGSPRVFRGHAGNAGALAFSPAGTRIAASGSDGTVHAWDVADGRELGFFRGHTGGVQCIAFGRDGTALISASADGTVKLWDVPAAPDPFPMKIGTWGFRVRFAPDGRRFAVSRRTVMVFDAASRRVLYQIPRPKNQPGFNALAYSRDGQLLAACADFTTHLVGVWDAEAGRPVATCRGHTGPIMAVAFGAGRQLASASDDGTVRLWDATTGRPGPVLRAHEGGAFAVAFDPAGTTLATIGWNGAVRLWDATTGRPLRQLGTTVQRQSEQFGDALAFDRHGRRLAAAGDDGTVCVWDAASGNELFTLRGHTAEVNGVAFSPDDRRLATGSEDHSIKLWDAANGDEVFTLRGHTAGVLGFAFSPDGNLIVSTGADTTVRLWDATPRPASSALGH
jgi:WD40 repeat protein/serine/threonine protein kinase